MRKLLFVGLLVVLLTVGMGGVASAIIMSTGDPFDAGSWAQQFRMSGAPAPGFDKLEWFIVGGSYNFDFEPTGFQSFTGTDGSWTGTVVNPNYSVATGNLDNDLYFNGHFSGNQNSGTMNTIWLTWRGSNLIEYGNFNKNAGSGWTWSNLNISSYNPNNFDRTQVPEPATMLLLGVGLVSVGMLRRRS